MQKKKGRKMLKPSKELFEMMYYNETIKAEDLAKLWHVKNQTIYNWAHEFRKQTIR